MGVAMNAARSQEVIGDGILTAALAPIRDGVPRSIAEREILRVVFDHHAIRAGGCSAGGPYGSAQMGTQTGGSGIAGRCMAWFGIRNACRWPDDHGRQLRNRERLAMVASSRRSGRECPGPHLVN